jgi:hypothetical protein
MSQQTTSTLPAADPREPLTALFTDLKSSANGL